MNKPGSHGRRWWQALPAIFLAGAANPPTAAAPLPRCGAAHLELGDGFHANLYMFEGSPEFVLSYDIPAEAIALRGASVGITPPQIIFYFVDTPAESYRTLSIGYQLGLRDSSGAWLHSYVPHVECGNGVTLDTPALVPSPAQHLACFQAMQDSGRYRLSFSPRRGEPPFGVIEGQWPLRAKVEAVRETWRRETERARRGQCRFSPPPPPD